MRVVSKKALRQCWEKHPDAKGPLESWHAEAKAAAWQSPAEIKAHYGSASILGDSRVCFNIGGNKYRLVVKINYGVGIVLIRFVGTHGEYDKIDAEVV